MKQVVEAIDFPRNYCNKIDEALFRPELTLEKMFQRDMHLKKLKKESEEAKAKVIEKLNECAEIKLSKRKEDSVKLLEEKAAIQHEKAL